MEPATNSWKENKSNSCCSQAEAEAVGRGWRIETPASSTTFWSVWPHWAVLNHFGQLLRSPTQSQKLVFLGTSKKILRKIEKNQINQLELKTQIKQFGLLLCQPLTNIDLIPLKENLHYYRGKNFSGQHLGVFLISRAIFSFASSGHPVLKKLKEEGTETSERQPTMILTKKSKSWKRKFVFCFEKKKQFGSNLRKLSSWIRPFLVM